MNVVRRLLSFSLAIYMQQLKLDITVTNVCVNYCRFLESHADATIEETQVCAPKLAQQFKHCSWLWSRVYGRLTNLRAIYREVI